MRKSDHTGIGRRRLLGLIAAGGLTAGLAGCSGGGSEASGATPPADGTPTAEATSTAGGEMPTADGDASGTSLAGSCGAAFGDTDQPYQATASQWVVEFAYPMGGEVYDEVSVGDEIGVGIGYVPDGDDGYAHELTVTQEDDATITAEELAREDEWEMGEPVTFDGTERSVAVQSSADSVAMAFVVETEGQDHGIVVTAAPGTAEPCTDVYTGVCRRVLQSMEPSE